MNTHQTYEEPSPYLGIENKFAEGRKFPVPMQKEMDPVGCDLLTYFWLTTLKLHALSGRVERNRNSNV